MKKTDTQNNEKHPPSELDILEFLEGIVFRQNSDEDFLDEDISDDVRRMADFSREFVQRFTGIQVPKDLSLISEIEALLTCLSNHIFGETIKSMLAYTKECANLNKLTRRVIVTVILYFSSFNSRKPVSGSQLVFQDDTDGFYVIDPVTNTTSTNSHSLNIHTVWNYFWANEKKPNNQFFFSYLENYFADHKETLEEVYDNKNSVILNTIRVHLTKDERTVRRWFKELSDDICSDKKTKVQKKKDYKKRYLEEETPKTIINIDNRQSNLDDEILGFYPNPNPVKPGIKIVNKLDFALNNQNINLEDLFNFSGQGILYGPPLSGKTTSLLEIAQSSEKCVYISCAELCKLNYPDISLYIKNILHKQIRNLGGKEYLLEHLSAVDYSSVLFLVDDVNLLPNEKLDWLIFQTDFFDRCLLATNNILPIMEKNEKYSIIEIMPFSESAKWKFISSGLATNETDLLPIYSDLDFCSYIGGMVFLFGNFHKPFEQIIIDFCKTLLKTDFCKEESVGLDKLFKYVTKKINERISIQQFQELRDYSVDEKNTQINEINMAISTSSIPLPETEEIMRGLQNPFFSSILRIEDNKIVFQYKEIAWIFVIASLEGRNPIGAYLTSQLGYMIFQTNVWGFFLNYFESCVNDNRRIGMIELINPK